MRRCLLLLTPCAALLSLHVDAAPVVIPPDRAAAPPRTDPGSGVCATAVHLSADGILTGVDVARFYLTRPPGAEGVDGRITTRYATVQLRNGADGAQTDHEGALPLPFSSVPGAPSAGNDRNIALRVRGYVNITRPGTYTFGVLANDGFSLAIGGEQVLRSTYTDVSLRDSRQVSFGAVGLYPIDLVYFQKDGPAVLELTRADQEDAEVASAPGRLPATFRPLAASALYSAAVGASPACTECGEDAACGAGTGQYCRDGLCQGCNIASRCGAACQPCSGDTPVCHGMRCVACSADDTSACDRQGLLCAENRCVRCVSDSQCGEGRTCDTAFGQCIKTPGTQYGGGCSAAGGGPGGAGACGGLLVLWLLLLLRRRRALCLFAIGAISAAAGRSAAQVAQDPASPASPVQFNTQTFRPATPGGVFSVEGTLMPRRMWPMGQVLFEYANRPLRLSLAESGETYAATVRGALTAHLMPGFTFARWGAVAIDLPVVLYQGFDERTPTRDAPVTPTAGGVGDLRLVGKFRLLDNRGGGFGLAAVPQLTFPTGSTASFRGDGTVGIEPRLAADYRFRNGIFIAVNLGLLIRTYNRNVDFGLVRVSDQVRWGVGAGVPIKAGFGVAGELIGAAGLSRLEGGPLYAPVEGYLGARWAHRSGIEVNAGGGAGLTNAVGSPNFRVFAGVSYALPDGRRPAARRPPPPSLPPPPPPAAPPPPPVEEDADGDGIADGEDKCPNRAGPADREGCPVEEPDAGKEGAGRTGDADGDGDGVVDRLDKCPERAGPKAAEGCPVLEVGAVAIRLERPIRFQAGAVTLERSSTLTIAELAKALAADPALKKAKIEVAGSGEDAKAARALAGRRAKALAAALLGAGVNRKRLQITAAKDPGGDEVEKVLLIKSKGKVKAPKDRKDRKAKKDKKDKKARKDRRDRKRK